MLRSAARSSADCCSPRLLRFSSCRASFLLSTGAGSGAGCMARRRSRRHRNHEVLQLRSEQRMTTEGNTQITPEGAHQGGEKKSRLFLFLVGIAVVLVIIGIFTLLQRREQYNALAKETEKSAIPTVAVIHPTVEPSQEDLVLPSTLQAYVESPIYARTTRYVKKWYHDIGSHVQKGDLLAEIETPEVDQHLSQARPDLGTMQSNEKLSRHTAPRPHALLNTR